jgi:hypothetical protein
MHPALIAPIRLAGLPVIVAVEAVAIAGFAAKDGGGAGRTG